MLIILEGPDGAGKTTLAEEIRKLIVVRHPGDKVEVLKKGPPREHPLNEYEWPLLDYRPNTGHHLILDRWHVGEWIYPAVFTRDTLADMAVWRHIEMFLQAKGAVMVHVSQHPDALQRILQTRGDELVSPSMVRGLVKAYGYQLAYTRLPLVATTRPDKSYVVAHQVIGKAMLQEHRFEAMTRYTTLIGSSRPNILFFGDVRNRVEDRDPRTPVFMPYRDTSGHYMLNLTTHLFRDAALANACDVDDPMRIWKDLHEPQVVALGRNAWNCVRDRIPNVVGIPHPQYIRRFHNRAGGEWLKAIHHGLTYKEDMIAWRPL
jgi:hypothetical protein